MEQYPARTCIDNYELDELVAKSAISSIYRGVHLSTGKQVAMKIPHAEIEGDPLFYSRLSREREIGKKLNHPSVVKVVDETDSPRTYIATEWIDGRLLRDILHQEGKLPQERARKIALAICDALEYIHSQGVVHRDLKPENIIVGGEDRITLIDFGIASLAGARRLTFGKLSQVMGSPDYISPEQVKGKRGDRRSDIYAAGVILYEMLTGKTPFAGSNPLAIMNSRLTNQPVPLREVDPTVSYLLEEIIYRTLERDPRHRYASAQELSRDLRQQDRVCIPLKRRGIRQIKRSTSVLLYGVLAMIPVVIFGLLLMVARHS